MRVRRASGETRPLGLMGTQQTLMWALPEMPESGESTPHSLTTTHDKRSKSQGTDSHREWHLLLDQLIGKVDSEPPELASGTDTPVLILKVAKVHLARTPQDLMALVSSTLSGIPQNPGYAQT